MTQAQVDFQKLLNLEQERHLQEEEKESKEAIKILETIPFPLEKTMTELQSELNQDIFSDDKAIKKGYNSTKIKARNFLTNVSYNRIKAADFKNKGFVIDCFTFLLLHLNPFYLERKFETEIEREFVNTLWTFLMPSNLYNYICQNENMKTLNKIKIKYQDAKDILLDFLESNNNDGFNVLSNFLEKNAILYQYLYGNLFPKCFSRVNDYGIRAKTLFNTYYTNFNVQKNIIEWQNNNLKMKDENSETTPINMTTLNDDEVKIENNEIKNENEIKIIEVDVKTTEFKKKKAAKHKVNNENKEKKREIKKQRLLKQLNENTEKLQKLKKPKMKISNK